jgi:hypothetical protein
MKRQRQAWEGGLPEPPDLFDVLWLSARENPPPPCKERDEIHADLQAFIEQMKEDRQKK